MRNSDAPKEVPSAARLESLITPRALHFPSTGGLPQTHTLFFSHQKSSYKNPTPCVLRDEHPYVLYLNPKSPPNPLSMAIAYFASRLSLGRLYQTHPMMFPRTLPFHSLGTWSSSSVASFGRAIPPLVVDLVDVDRGLTRECATGHNHQPLQPLNLKKLPPKVSSINPIINFMFSKSRSRKSHTNFCDRRPPAPHNRAAPTSSTCATPFPTTTLLSLLFVILTSPSTLIPLADMYCF